VGKCAVQTGNRLYFMYMSYCTNVRYEVGHTMGWRSANQRSSKSRYRHLSGAPLVNEVRKGAGGVPATPQSLLTGKMGSPFFFFSILYFFFIFSFPCLPLPQDQSSSSLGLTTPLSHQTGQDKTSDFSNLGLDSNNLPRVTQESLQLEELHPSRGELNSSSAILLGFQVQLPFFLFSLYPLLLSVLSPRPSPRNITAMLRGRHAVTALRATAQPAASRSFISSSAVAAVSPPRKPVSGTRRHTTATSNAS